MGIICLRASSLNSGHWRFVLPNRKIHCGNFSQVRKVIFGRNLGASNPQFGGFNLKVRRHLPYYALSLSKAGSCCGGWDDKNNNTYRR
jgi:hypothetical protein